MLCSTFFVAYGVWGVGSTLPSTINRGAPPVFFQLQAIMGLVTGSSEQQTRVKLLLGLWLIVNGVESFWLWWDEAMPGWDQANHLKASLYYLQAFQEGRWFDIWEISNKYPPLTYILGALSQGLFGTGNDSALLINWGFNTIIMVSVYLLGQRLFNGTVAGWSAAIVLLLPRLSLFRLSFLTDITLATSTVLCFTCLTYWNFADQRRQQWFWSVAFGASLGLALLSKQTSLFFFFFPLLAAISYHLWQRHWQKILQLLTGFVIALLICWPWYRTNWIYAFSSYSSGIVQASINEGDPAINTVKAWIYYLVDLPYALSWIWILLPSIAIILYGFKCLPSGPRTYSLPLHKGLTWLAIYLVGSYVLFSLFQNKDARYIIPYLPVFAVLAGYGISLWSDRLRPIAWGSLGLAIVLWFSSLFPMPNQGTVLGSWPHPAEHPRRYPQPEVIATAIEKTPYLRANLGVIPSIFDFNHNNVGYFGALQGFQVSARELGSRPESVAQDARSFDWFVAKNEAFPQDHAKETQIALGKRLATDPAFERIQTWTLPDESDLYLYHRRQPLVTVTALDHPTTSDALHLEVEVPQKARMGEPVPVTYRWLGNWPTLQDGLVLLTWYQEGNKVPTDQFWIQDHQIGFGMLFDPEDAPSPNQAFEVTETTAMLPPAALSPGQYTLSAEYVNPQTGQRYPLAVQTIALELDPSAATVQSPELDWLSQLRHLAPLMNQGIQGLEQIFDQVGRINQYTPVSDYLKDTQLSMSLRLDQPSPDSPIAPTLVQQENWYLSKALAHILREESAEAIATFQALIHLNPNNPYAYIYKAFVHLYDWHPGLARQALQPALTLAPDLPEAQIMDAATRLFTGQIFTALDQIKALEAQGIL